VQETSAFDLFICSRCCFRSNFHSRSNKQKRKKKLNL